MNFSDINQNNDDLSTLRNQVDTLSNSVGFQKTLNVALSGSTTISTNGTFPYLVSVVVDHNLGYVPAFIAFVNQGSGAFAQYLQLPLINGGSTGIQSMVSAYSSATQLTFTVNVYTAGPPSTLPLKYYIFNEPTSV